MGLIGGSLCGPSSAAPLDPHTRRSKPPPPSALKHECSPVTLTAPQRALVQVNCVFIVHEIWNTDTHVPDNQARDLWHNNKTEVGTHHVVSSPPARRFDCQQDEAKTTKRFSTELC